MRQSPEFRKEEIESLVNKAFERANGLLNQDEINPEDFKDLYDSATIDKDLEYVTTLEAKFDKQMSQSERDHIRLAKVFEAILHEHGEQSNWFGDSAVTIKTSRFDDIMNGVDEVVEFEEPESTSYLALAVDATYSVFTEKKLKRIEDEIGRGELAKIKYAVFENTGFRGELTKVPRVIVGVSSKTIQELAELWLSGRNQDLARHPVQFQILESIIIQCEAFSKYASSKDQTEVAKKYEHAGNIVRRIMEEKKKVLRDSGARDDVFVALDLGLNRFRR